MKNQKTLKSNFMLLIAAFIWGSAFVAQSVGSELLQGFTFNSVRMLVGCLILLPVICLCDRLHISHRPQTKEERRALLTAGLACGAVLCVASNLQQIGMTPDNSGKAGFITAMYIVLVPVSGLLFGKRCSATVWISVAVATAGLYLLCIKKNFTVDVTDLYLIGCAVAYTFHILVVDYFAPKVDGVRLSCIQFGVAGILGLPFLFLLETPTLTAIWACRTSILYAGFMSCGVAYTLQIMAQRHAEPTVASLLMSLESVFAALTTWAVLHTVLSLREAIGSMLIFIAVISAQLPHGWYRFLFHKRSGI